MTDRLRLQSLKWKWTKKPIALTRDSDISLGAKAMYDAIYSHADPQGEGAFPSMNTLAGYLGVSRRTARRYVTELEKHGWLKRDQTRKGEHGEQTSNLYTLMLEKDTPRTSVSYPSDGDDLAPSDTDVRQTRVPIEREDSAPDGAPGAEEGSPEPPPEPPKKPTKRSKKELDELFEALAAGSFGITDMSLVGKLGGRIGELRKWLVENFPDHQGVHVKAFYAWWRSQYGDADAPRDPGKFAEHYLKFVQLKRQGREKPRRAKPAVIDFPDVDPEERRRQAEQLAASKPDVLKEAAGD